MQNTNRLASFYKWLFAIALSFFGVYAVWHIVMWLGNPWQNEFREGIVLPVADCFLRGGSPYDGQTSVNLGFVYGFLPSLLVAGVQAIIGVGSRMLENRLLSVGCTLAVAFLIEREAIRLSCRKVPRFLACSIMIPAGWILCEVDARADHLATLLSVLALVVIMHKASWARISASAIFTILAFYSKQYLILIGFPIFIYLLTVDFRKAFGYGFLSALLLCTSIVVVNWLFPLYFSMAIFCTGSSIASSLTHMLLQSAIFGWFYWPLLLVILLGVFNSRHAKITWRKPSPARLVALATISSVLFLTIRLGGNDGAILSYYYQLLLPWTVLWAAALWPKINGNTITLSTISFGILLFSLWHFGPYRDNQPSKQGLELRFGAFAFTPLLSYQDHAEWSRLKNKLSSFTPETVLVETPACCSMAFELGIQNYEPGHSYKWCMSPVCENPSAVVKALPWLSRGATAAYDRWKSYHNTIANDLENGRFDAVLASADCIADNPYPLPPESHYEISDSFLLRTGYQTSKVSLYTRKSMTLRP